VALAADRGRYNPTNFDTAQPLPFKFGQWWRLLTLQASSVKPLSDRTMVVNHSTSSMSWSEKVAS
jgi:hypothetical protein